MNSIIPKISLSEALAKVEQIESLVEAGWTIEGAELHVLGEISDVPIDEAAGVNSALDRYIAVFRAFEMKEEYLAERAKEIRKQKISVSNAFERFKARVKWFIAENPEREFRGSTEAFKLKKPGGKPKLKLKFDTYRVEGLIREELIAEFGLPESCYKKMTVYKLDNDAARKHMQGIYEKEGVPDLIVKGNIIEGSANFGTLERELKLKVE